MYGYRGGVERRQSEQRCAVRAVLTLVTLLGLIGMHGLPGAMSSPGGAPAMLGNASMSSPRAASAPAGESAAMLRVAHAGRAGARVAQPVWSGQSADRSVAAPVGCPMAHEGCVAVLRDAGHWAPAATVPVAGAIPVMPRRVPVANPANGPRAPPDVSLIGLGISRT